MANIDLIVMQSSQANAVRGLTVSGHALAPVPTLSGPFVLPRPCAFDAYHASKQALLQSYPHFQLASSNLWPVQEDSSGPPQPVIWPSSLQQLVAACTYSSSWPVGVTIAVST